MHPVDNQGGIPQSVGSSPGSASGAHTRAPIMRSSSPYIHNEGRQIETPMDEQSETSREGGTSIVVATTSASTISPDPLWVDLAHRPTARSPITFGAPHSPSLAPPLAPPAHAFGAQDRLALLRRATHMNPEVRKEIEDRRKLADFQQLIDRTPHARRVEVMEGKIADVLQLSDGSLLKWL